MGVVSVIVPIYHGKQYINQMIEQIEVCAENFSGEMELLLINDDPSDIIEEHLSSEKISIRVVNTDSNRGIHGARVRGLSYAKGEYVLFLDQDDIVSPRYVQSQILKMENADAVVCRLVNDKRVYYDERRIFENVVTRDYMIARENSIVSPGQVLIRKDAISAVWKRNILQYNGADDWLLWLCMYGEGKQIVLNDDILFERIVDGNNASWKTEQMMRSEYEVLDIVKKALFLSYEEERSLELALENKNYERMRLLDKFRKMFYLYDEWMALRHAGISPLAELKKIGIKSVALYGAGNIGECIKRELEEQGFSVKYFIDINAMHLEENIPVFMPTEDLPMVDGVIITLVEHVDEVKVMLEKKVNVPIFSISELVQGKCK